MILRFGVQNFRSFRDYTELSFISTARKDEPGFRLKSKHSSYGVLPVVGIWGANASGKSNLIEAFTSFIKLLSSSYTGFQPQEDIPWTPFRLQDDSKAPHSQFDIDFEVEGVRYHYGFCFTKYGFTEEWLHAYFTSRQRILFHRNNDAKDAWYFGPSLKGPRNNIASATRQNSLFLSAAAQHNHELLGKLYETILLGVEYRKRISTLPIYSKDSVLLEEVSKPIVECILSGADLGVVGFREVKGSEGALKNYMSIDKILSDDSLESLRSKLDDVRELWLQHGTEEDYWELPPLYESSGTNILLKLLQTILKTLRQGTLFIVDELDMSLHSDFTSVLLSLFTQKETNPNGAQLLFTTQDQNLLDHLRTDEVLLVDKDNSGASTVCTASDYRIRTRDSLQHLYKTGQIRGIPILGNIAELTEKFLAKSENE